MIVWLKQFGAVVIAAIAFLGADDATAREVLTLATTTSTENSGLLSHIHQDFQRKTGIRVKVIAKGTGASLQLARDGNADVVLVHAPQQEEEFVAKGHGVMRRHVMHNDFVIIGPKADPAGIRKARTPSGALKQLAAAGQVFISRGDGSGTHIKEQEFWRETGLRLESETVTVFAQGKRRQLRSVRPPGRWYLSIGQGMGKAILMATERQAYTLADRGTYYAFALPEPGKTDLAILCEGDQSLHNPYGVIVVNPARHPHVNFKAAKQYIRWITSPGVRQMIGRYTVGGKVLFYANPVPPAAGDAVPPAAGDAVPPNKP